MASPLVLVFDSGVGGLSVFDRIAARMPHISLAYAADNEAFPYGTKTEEAVIARVCTIVPELVRDLKPDLVVIACNTASTVALEALRAQVKIPVVGVVPAIKPAAEMSRSRVIGLLGTPGTVRRVYTQDLIDNYAGDCTVIRHGSAELVEIAERKLRGRAPAQAEMQAIVDALLNQPRGREMDVVVLACTHFPLVGAELAARAPANIAWIDSGDAIARRVEHLLTISRLPLAAETPDRTAFFTAPGATMDALQTTLNIRGINDIRIMSSTRREIAYP